MILLLDCDGRVCLANDATLMKFAYTQEQIQSLSILDLQSEEEAAANRKNSDFWPSIVNAEHDSYECVMRTSSSGDFPARLVFSVIDDWEWQKGHAQEEQPIVCLDIENLSEQKLVERSQAFQTLKIKREGKAKAQFLSTMSHEIRTPLYGVIAALDLIDAEKIPSRQQELLDIAGLSSKSLIQILDDVLDFSRLDGNHVTLESHDFDVIKLINNVVKLIEMQRDSGKKRNIVINKNIDDKIPQRVIGDPTRLQQILLNLLSNALKFTEQGMVQVSVTMIDDDPLADNDLISLRFEVSDTGPGIEATVKSSLFDAFTQADESITRKFGGTGLGLAICKQLTQLMRGEIGVSSVPGEGATFWFSLPFKVSTFSDEKNCGIVSSGEIFGHVPQLQQASPAITGEGYRVLLVDDSETNRYLGQLMLEASGYSVSVAANGLNALEIATTQIFDLILTDLQMPGLDGFDLCRRLHQDKAIVQRTPVIAMSADITGEVKQRCKESGMVGYIAKPVTQAVLSETLAQFRLFDKTAGNSDLVQVSSTPLEIMNDVIVASGTTSGVMPEIETNLIHWGAFHNLRELAGDRLPNLIGVFLQENSRRINRMSDLLEHNDLAGLAAEMHALKSGAGSYGAVRLCDGAKTLERYTTEKSVEDCRVSALELQEIWNCTAHALRSYITVEFDDELNETPAGASASAAETMAPIPLSTIEPMITARPSRIMVVDDDVAMARSIRRVLARSLRSSEIMVVNDAIDMAEQLDNFMPDLITLDINMPQLSGLEAIPYIHGHQVQDPKILVISGMARRALSDALVAGADAVLAKPFDNTDLMKMVVMLLETDESPGGQLEGIL